MKRVITFIITITLLIGFSQCKKQVEQIAAVTPGVNGNLVHISVNAGHGDKHVVYLESGAYLGCSTQHGS